MSFINKNNNTAISQVMFYGQAESLTADQRADIQAIAEDVEAAGVDTLFSTEILSDLNSIFGVTEVIGLIIAGIVLFVMFGTFLAVGLPLLMALSGVAAGVGGTLALSSLIDMQSITLFIVHRHRTQLLAGMPLRESIGRSIGTSGNAVVFAGLTVIIALSALVVSGLPFIAILGLSAAFTVLMSVLLSITLTPALLAVMGEKVLTKKGRAARAEAVAAISVTAGSSTVAHAHGSKPSASLWWVKTLTSAPWLAALASIIVLGVIAIPVASMKTALPDGGSEPYGSDAQRAYEITSQQFGPGFNGQLILLAELDNPEDENAATEQLLEVAERISTTDGVFAAVPAVTNEELTFGAIQIVPASGPADPATEEIVHELRGMTDTIKAETGVTAHITGQVAAQIDVSEKINAALPPYLIIVVGLSLILMLLVFRSVVVPLIATLGFLLSLAAAFGSTVAVYQWGWFGPLFDVHNPAPIMSFLPILLTGILFGLAMDYQVFLVTAMREAYAHGSSARDAVKQGFNLAAPVVVAAALIMVSVFAGFTFSHLTMIRPIGFALAIGVLFDAFVVRMTLTPAIMHLLGDKAWYLPAWLERILPDVDVEGAKLEESVPPADSTENVPSTPVTAGDAR
jgi:RND superfamily putative drug exporter